MWRTSGQAFQAKSQNLVLSLKFPYSPQSKSGASRLNVSLGRFFYLSVEFELRHSFPTIFLISDTDHAYPISFDVC